MNLIFTILKIHNLFIFIYFIVNEEVIEIKFLKILIRFYFENNYSEGFLIIIILLITIIIYYFL